MRRVRTPSRVRAPGVEPFGVQVDFLDDAVVDDDRSAIFETQMKEERIGLSGLEGMTVDASPFGDEARADNRAFLEAFERPSPKRKIGIILITGKDEAVRDPRGTRLKQLSSSSSSILFSTVAA